MSTRPPSDPAEAAPVFAAIGDRTRLDIVALLARGEPRSIAELTCGRGLTRQAVAKHLRTLGQAGLIKGVRTGREHRFALRPAAFDGAAAFLAALGEQWDGALARLRSQVEDEPHELPAPGAIGRPSRPPSG